MRASKWRKSERGGGLVLKAISLYLQARYAILKAYATGREEGKVKTPTCHMKLMPESLFWLCLRNRISLLHNGVIDQHLRPVV